MGVKKAVQTMSYQTEKKFLHISQIIFLLGL